MKQQKILSIETLKENKALLRNCSPEFYPYICTVINRLPKDVVSKQVLNNSSFSIMSFPKESFGYCLQFENPLKHLLILNETVLDRPDFEIIHTIVHEIAHKVIDKAATHLHEMEAEKLLVEWRFEEESKSVRYYRPIVESEGYNIGYNWAKTTNDQTKLSCIEDFLDEWDQGGFSPERYENLLLVANPSSIINKNLLADDKQKLSDESERNFDYLQRCVIWGILHFLKEKKYNERRKTTDR